MGWLAKANELAVTIHRDSRRGVKRRRIRGAFTGEQPSQASSLHRQAAFRGEQPSEVRSLQPRGAFSGEQTAEANNSSEIPRISSILTVPFIH